MVNQDRNIFGAVLLQLGEADAMITGVTRTYAQTMREVRKVIDVEAGRTAFGIHVMVGMGLIFWILRRSLAPGARMFANALGLLVVGLFFVFLGYLVAVSWVLWVGVGIAVLGVLGSVAFFGRARRAAGEGEFSSRYFAPVDLVGLYWHLVDLIWIFLFPLLYLIH